MDRAVAESLATQIRQQVKSVSQGIGALELMIREAKNGNAHQALGYESWTAFLADVLAGLRTPDVVGSFMRCRGL